jgi:hypothetical protein
VVGVVADRAGMRLGLSTATLCPLAMALLLLWMRRLHSVSSKARMAPH